MMKKLGIAAMLAATLFAGACSNAPQDQPPRQPIAVSTAGAPVRDVPTVTRQDLPRASPAASAAIVEHDALMKRDGRPISKQEFVDCMDPEKRKDCKRSIHSSVTWQTYNTLFSERFGVSHSSYATWRAMMLSDDVTTIACTADMVKKNYMARVHMKTGVITYDFERSNCYGGESVFAYKGTPVISDVCLNGFKPKGPQEVSKPTCVDPKKGCPPKT